MSQRGGHQGGDWGVTQPFGGNLSPKTESATPSPFPSPSDPGVDPFLVIEAPAHIGPDRWQTSYYDPRSQKQVSDYVKLGEHAGPLDINSGKSTGQGFHDGHRWQQV